MRGFRKSTGSVDVSGHGAILLRFGRRNDARIVRALGCRAGCRSSSPGEPSGAPQAGAGARSGPAADCWSACRRRRAGAGSSGRSLALRRAGRPCSARARLCPDRPRGGQNGSDASRGDDCSTGHDGFLLGGFYVSAQRAQPTCGRSAPARMPSCTRSLANWSELLARVLRARVRRVLGHLGLISPVRQLALIDADVASLEWLCAALTHPGQPTR